MVIAFATVFGDSLTRYSFLSRGALRLCRALEFWPDVIHAHDWPAALVPVYLNVLEQGTPLGRAASVLTLFSTGVSAKAHDRGPGR